MTKYGGYMGKIIKLDLSKRTVEEYPWTDKDRRLYIGAKGTASKILFDNLKGTEDPLGPENIIVVSTGPVTGTGAPSSSRFDISTLSPQTGITTSSNCGGNFGYYLKKAGYDALVITGKCEELTWISINNDVIEYHSAEDLKGLRVTPAQETLQEKIDALLGRSVKCGMVTIGPAGENLVKYSAVISGERAAGRAGVGAVFGSKNLKAMVVTGDKEVPIYNPEKTYKLNLKWNETLHSHPLTGDQLPRMGTAGLVSSMQVNKQLASRNFAEGTFKDFEMVSGEALAECEDTHIGSCMTCPIRCTRRVKVDGKDVKGPELETLGLMGGNLQNNNLDLICKWNYEIDELGMDAISTAGTLAWAMEANEKGLFDSGLEFGKTDNIVQTLEDIAFRRGIGNELAEGTKRLSEKYGGTEFAIQSKGLELSAYEPRRAVGQGLGYAVSNRGGCHLNGGYPVVLEGLGMHIDQQTPKGKADLCMVLQDLMDAISCCGHCLFTSYAVFPAFLISKPNNAFTKMIYKVVPHVGGVVRLINKCPEIACFHLWLIPHTKEVQYTTGMRLTVGKFIRIGERNYNTERAVNARFGVCAEKDKLPKRLTDVCQDPNDPTTKVPLEQMKKTYYKARGWNENGLPDEKKLRRMKII